ncbi:MAG: hypothetical protein ACE5K1_04900 [Acidiferrobacterales bacterium]
MAMLSSWFNVHRMFAVVLALVCGMLLGTTESVVGESKETAARGQLGKTVFVDISALGRRNKAAKKMTKMHAEFARQGWTVIDVSVYSENDDLEGFFVTYVKN